MTGDSVESDRLEKEIDNLHITFAADAESGKKCTYLNGVCVEQAIRSMEVSRHVSTVSKLAFVRTALVDAQRRIGEKKGIVMDGRDIGTTVFPDAELKIFLTASPEVRAQRRVDELRGKGQTVSYKEVLHNVKERDRIDETREVDPLRRADDALLLDNSAMTLQQQDEWLLRAYRRAVGLDK